MSAGDLSFLLRASITSPDLSCKTISLYSSFLPELEEASQSISMALWANAFYCLRKVDRNIRIIYSTIILSHSYYIQ